MIFNIYSKAGFLNSGTIGDLGLMLVGNCPMPFRMCSNILGLQPLDVSSTSVL